MPDLKIFCTSIKYFKILDKLPNYIQPLGLGKESFPSNWLDEKNGKNIFHLNNYYGELTGIYWIWKNQIEKMNDDDKIGNCHYRKLWLNNLYLEKQKFSCSSLYSNLLKRDNPIILSNKNVQVQPIIFKNKNLISDFYEIHSTNIIEKSIEFLEPKYQDAFKKHLNSNILFPLNMFITDVKSFKIYCEIIFPWLKKCHDLCQKNKLIKGDNLRLPAFMAERFTSFWFSQNPNKVELSYARLGNNFLSNNFNKILNPIKLPFSFRMYPTIHKY
tara:strand:+ start:2632 stop:3447 length:816 start_codon:yes stop_codon:yes gene_type:complete